MSSAARTKSSAAKAKPRLRSRSRDLAERRPSLVRLLIALFVARVAVTVVEVAETRLTWWSVFVTAAIGLEAWRAWSVSRVRQGAGDRPAPAPLPESRSDRFLRPLERRGPVILYTLTAVFLVAALVLVILGNPHDVLLDIAIIVRELTTLLFLAVIVAGYLSLRRAGR